MARAYTAWQLTRPSGIALMVALGILALVVLVGVGLQLGRHLALGTPVDASVLGFVPLPVLLYAAYAAFCYVYARIVCRRSYPAGAEYGIRVDDDDLWSQTPHGTSELRFSAIRKVYDRRPVLILRVASLVGGVAMLPRDPLTDDDVARLLAATG
ncbi:MAG: hypothetical protein QM777_18295 [Pseudorhodoferax sp.]